MWLRRQRNTIPAFDALSCVNAGAYGLPLVLLAKQMAAPLDAMVAPASGAASPRRFHHGVAGTHARIHRRHPGRAG